jgi:DNA-binding PadR family transcriptional regulator
LTVRYRHIDGAWDTNAEGRRVKSYTLTAAGRRQLVSEKRQWALITAAVNLVLGER